MWSKNLQDKLTIRSEIADQFEDVSHLQAVHFAYPSGGQVVISDPVGRFIGEDGSATYISQDQTVTRLKPGWDLSSWKPKAGMPHVIKSDVGLR